MPPEVRREQLATEYQQVKAEATRAKLAADKPRQKAAGMLLRDLINEMAQLGAPCMLALPG